MADRKITDMSALAAGAQATGDLITLVDISEAAAADKNKKMTLQDLFTGIPFNVGIGGTPSSPNISLNSDGSCEFAADVVINDVTIGRSVGNKLSNTALGYDTLANNTDGVQNTAVGSEALPQNTTGGQNTAVGYRSIQNNTTGSNNTAIGRQSVNSNETGDNNTGIGSNALRDNIDGNFNTAVGSRALAENTASNNTAVGFGSLVSNTTGTGNTAIGRDSLGDNTEGSFNVAMGYITFNSNTTGDSNTAIGAQALENSTTADGSTAVGRNALQGNTTGTQNTACGLSALQNNTTGQKNTGVGVLAGKFKQDATDSTDLDNCTLLGNSSRASGSNQVQLGNSSTTTYAYGSVQDRSDARDKADIRDTLLGLGFINSLRPVDFRWDMRDDYYNIEVYEEEETKTIKERLVPIPKDGSRKRTRFHHGLIAQEVKAAADSHGVDFAGYQDHNIANGTDVLSLGYTEMIAPLIKAVQELSAENETLKARLDALEA